MRKYLFLLGLPLFSGCFEDDPSLAREPIFFSVGQADLGSTSEADYLDQVFYDVEGNRVSATVNRERWDLAIGCRAEQPNLFVNSAVLMSVAFTGDLQWKGPYRVEDYKFQFERAANYLQRGLIPRSLPGKEPQGEVFLIDLGRDRNNRKRGHRVLQWQGYSDGTYFLRLANLDGSNAVDLEIPIHPDYANVYLSFDEPQETLLLEPRKEEWDILFTRYMERLFDGRDTLDYSVTGALLQPNTWETAAWTDSSKSFDDLTLDDLQQQYFAPGISRLGHDWKDFDLDANGFTVLPHRYYALRKGPQGPWYKWQFTDFYNAQGKKGVIGFRYLGF